MKSLKKEVCDAKTFYLAVTCILLCVICGVSILSYLDEEKILTNKIGKFCAEKLDNCSTKLDRISRNTMRMMCKMVNPTDDIRNFPKATGALRKVQIADTIFLKKVIEILDRNNVPYWLDCGTLLGCIRHGGFIPWDDDIDIGMMREDYDKLPKIFENEFKDDPDFYFVSGHFGKVIHKSSGLVIDIFPMDIYPKYLPDAFSRVDLKNEIYKYKSNFRIEDKYVDGKRVYKKKDKFGNELSEEDVLEMRNKLFNVEETSTDKKLVVYAPEHWENYIFDYDWIFPLKIATFEGILVKIPNRSDTYLFEEYGDWMQYPETLCGHKETNNMKGASSVYYHNILDLIKKYGDDDLN